MVLKTDNRYRTIKKIFTFFIVLIPILQYYKSFIPNINLATFFALIFLVCFGFELFLNKMKHSKYYLPFNLYFCFICLSFIITTIYYSYKLNWEHVSPFVRFIVLATSLFFLGKKYFLIDKVAKYLGIVILISSFLIFFSTIVFSLFGIRIPFRIMPLLSGSEYYIIRERFSGLYMEPAHFAQASSIYLILLLFKNTNEKNRITKIIITSIAIIVSGSGQGYLFLFIIFMMWSFFFLFYTGLNKSKFFFYFCSLVIIILLLLLLYKTSVVQFALSRLIDENGNLGGKALRGRTWTNAKFDLLNKKQKWLGIGLGHVDDITTGYMNSLYQHLIQFGYPSLPFLFFIPLYAFFQKEAYAKALAIIYFLLIFFTASASSMMICYYSLFLLCGNNKSLFKSRRKS